MKKMFIRLNNSAATYDQWYYNGSWFVNSFSLSLIDNCYFIPLSGIYVVLTAGI